MSLKEAYQLAHSAECRLHLEAHRPDRNLRFVVGHLMHYEALRLRIVEIEHDVSQSDQASQVKFQGTGHVGAQPLEVQRKPSTGQLGRRSPPPPPNYADDLSSTDSDNSDEFADEMEDSEGDIEGLVLERFPSASTKPPRPSGQGDAAAVPADPPPADVPPPLEADTGADEDEDDPPSPELPDEATLAQITQGPGDTLYPQIFNGMRQCPCLDHNKDCPTVGKMWMLPQGKDGKMRAIAEVREVEQKVQ